MMPTLEELRVQCRIDDDNEQENALLMMLSTTDEK